MPPSSNSRLPYRPALDGVRFIAVYLVLLFHATLPTMAGGFIGVDVFFVLSGYLVTRLLLTDLSAGTFSLLTFYDRRVRRLLPAALTVLVVIAATWLAIATPYDRAVVADDSRAAALYFSNWHFAAKATDYFASHDAASPILHFWSLSTEEQFYLVWPVLVLGVWRLAGSRERRALRLLTLVAVVLAASSLAALAVTLAGGHSALAYFATHTRAYQLLFGALLALAWHRLGSTRLRGSGGPRGAWLEPVALAALVVLATDLIDLDPSVRGIGAAVAATALLLGLERRPTAATARLLALPPLVYLGQISYATYLWHWPVILVAQRFATVGPWTLAAVGALVATGLAALSQRLLELPIRRSRTLAEHRPQVVTAGLAASLLVGLVLLPPALHSERRPVVGAAGGSQRLGSGLGRVPVSGLDLGAASALPVGAIAGGKLTPDVSCTRTPVDSCVLVRGTGRHLLLMGDSHALMLAPAFRAIAKREGLTLSVAAGRGCPWQAGLVFTNSDHDSCRRMKRVWYGKVIPEMRPDVIVLVSRATDHAVGAGYSVSPDDPLLGRGTQSELLAKATRLSLERLVAPGRRLVVVEPLPVAPFHVRSCMTGARYADECAFVTDSRPSAAELAYRSFATDLRGVSAVDLDAISCPRMPICDALVSGTLVRSDHDHLTPRFAGLVAEEVDWALHAAGVL